MRFATSWGIAALVLAGWACSSKSGGSADAGAAGGTGDGAGGAAGAGGGLDAGADAVADAAADARASEDRPGDAGTTVTCPKTVADLCAAGDPPPGTSTGPFCRSTVTAAENDPIFCPAGRASTVATCGAYTVVRNVGADSGYFYYYDSSGALVAVTQVGNSGERCLGGPPTFGPATFATPSACGAATVLPACERDGSADGAR